MAINIVEAKPEPFCRGLMIFNGVLRKFILQLHKKTIRNKIGIESGPQEVLNVKPRTLQVQLAVFGVLLYDSHQ